MCSPSGTSSPGAEPVRRLFHRGSAFQIDLVVGQDVKTCSLFPGLPPAEGKNAQLPGAHCAPLRQRAANQAIDEQKQRNPEIRLRQSLLQGNSI